MEELFLLMRGTKRTGVDSVEGKEKVELTLAGEETDQH